MTISISWYCRPESDFNAFYTVQSYFWFSLAQIQIISYFVRITKEQKWDTFSLTKIKISSFTAWLSNDASIRNVEVLLFSISNRAQVRKTRQVWNQPAVTLLCCLCVDTQSIFTVWSHLVALSAVSSSLTCFLVGFWSWKKKKSHLRWKQLLCSQDSFHFQSKQQRILTDGLAATGPLRSVHKGDLLCSFPHSLSKIILLDLMLAPQLCCFRSMNSLLIYFHIHEKAETLEALGLTGSGIGHGAGWMNCLRISCCGVWDLLLTTVSFTYKTRWQQWLKDSSCLKLSSEQATGCFMLQYLEWPLREPGSTE